ncbi:MAG: hypothetical protein ABUS48_04105 [Pseudomonadota bacterium]
MSREGTTLMGAVEFFVGLLACWIGFVLIVDRWRSFRALFPVGNAAKLAGRVGFALLLAGVVLQVMGAAQIS